jgi:hypothetical protein
MMDDTKHVPRPKSPSKFVDPAEFSALTRLPRFTDEIRFTSA